VLSLIREPLPVPQPGEVLIRVEAAGVSFGDVAQRSGVFFAGAPKMLYTPGYDVVGTVEAIGDEVIDTALGDRVAALTIFGGYARYACAPGEWLEAATTTGRSKGCRFGPELHFGMRLTKTFAN